MTQVVDVAQACEKTKESASEECLLAVGSVQGCLAKSCKGALFFVARERMVMFEKKRLMYPELRVRVQVDNIKLHLRSMSFDLREKKRVTHSIFSRNANY